MVDRLTYSEQREYTRIANRVLGRVSLCSPLRLGNTVDRL
jgi:hypothetical protein